MNLMSRGSAMLSRRLGTAAGVGVTYSRGGASCEIYDAVPSEAQSPSAHAPGVPGRLDSTERDYLFPALSLDFGVGPVEPRAGDRVTETVGGLPVIYELAPKGDEPAWRYSDHGRTTYRVHCKRVD